MAPVMSVTARLASLAIMEPDTDGCLPQSFCIFFPQERDFRGLVPRLFLSKWRDPFMTDSSWKRGWLLVAGLLGAYGVGFGAYSAHGLAGHEQELADKASHFALIHALALLALSQRNERLNFLVKASAGFFVLGSLLFCGSLTLLAVSSCPAAAMAPFGGSSFMLGWSLLAVSALRRGL